MVWFHLRFHCFPVDVFLLLCWVQANFWIELSSEGNRNSCGTRLTGFDPGSASYYWTSLNLSFCKVPVQLLSRVRLFVTPWTAARQDSLSITSSHSLLKLGSIESVMPSNHLILCCPLLPPSVFPASRSLQMSEFFAWGGQRIGVSASASVLPVNIQDWFPLGWTSLISLQSKGLSTVFSSTTVSKQFFGAQLSL